MAAKTKLVVNLTSGNTLCVSELADGPFRRMKGLIGRRGLPTGEGLLLRPAPAIHTAFMKFPIDAVFLDRDLRVLDIAAWLAPWRIASKAGARSVLELSAGECDRCGVEVGHRLGLRDRDSASGSNGVPSTLRAGAREELTSSESIIWPSAPEDAGRVARLQPLQVLVVSGDHHFRSVTTMLLRHRGCSVTTTTSTSRVAELAVRNLIDVVVIDTDADFSAAEAAGVAVEGLSTRVGVVAVCENPGLAPQQVRALHKSGPFEALFATIERADAGRESRDTVP
jgi:uncharacterized protein